VPGVASAAANAQDEKATAAISQGGQFLGKARDGRQIDPPAISPTCAKVQAQKSILPPGNPLIDAEPPCPVAARSCRSRSTATTFPAVLEK